VPIYAGCPHALNLVYPEEKTFRQDEDAGSAGGTAQRSAAKHENDYNDQEQEPDRASANIEGIGKKWRG
jgi:hypothetical protein